MRWTKKHAAAAARRFAASEAATYWNLFAPPIRACLIDAHLVSELQTADSVDSAITLTASEIMEFRRMLIAELAAGVKAHSRAMTVRFSIYD